MTMRKTFALLLTIVLLSSFAAKDHETYLSVTEIEYNKEQKSLQIISRVFIDDLEDVLSKRYQQEVSLSYKKDLKLNKDLIEKYINKKLSIAINDESQKLKLLGSKFDADQIVLFIECTNVQSFKKVRVDPLPPTSKTQLSKTSISRFSCSTASIGSVERSTYFESIIVFE